MKLLGCHANITPTLGFTAADIAAWDTSYDEREGPKVLPAGYLGNQYYGPDWMLSGNIAQLTP